MFQHSIFILLVLSNSMVMPIQTLQFCNIILPAERLVKYREANIMNCDYAKFDENSKYMTNLQNLKITDRSLSAMPAGVFNLKNLTNLDVYDTKIINLGHRFLLLRKIESLSFVGNHIKKIPLEIFELPELKSLLIIETDLSELNHSALLASNIVELTLLENKIGLLPRNLCELRIRRIGIFIQNNLEYGQSLTEYSKRIKAKIEKMFPRCIVEPYQAP